MSTDKQNSIEPSQMKMSQVMQSQVSYKEDDPIHYELPSQKIGDKFNVSVASLGDIYKFPKDNEQYEGLYNGVNDKFKEPKRFQRDPNTGRPSSSMIMEKKGKVNNVFLNPSSLQTEPNERALKRSKAVDVNYLHMTTLPDSNRFSHVANGRINPPQSTFSVKKIIESNIKAHEEDMRPTVLFPNRVRIKFVPPQDRTLKGTQTLRESMKAKDNPMILIGQKVNVNKDSAKHTDEHVKFTHSSEVDYKPRALSSQKARKTLQVSEKFVGAVQDYFRSNEMKIPSKNTINDIAKYAKNVEKTLDKFAMEIEKKKGESARKFEDPFRKKLRKKKVIKPKPPKAYPIIDDDYQRNVEEKLAKLQIELRQIFDSLSQKGFVESGDNEKVQKMINKAKELAGLISHLANDVKKSREMHIKKEKEEKAKEANETKKDLPLNKKSIVEVSKANINQSIQIDSMNLSTLPNTQPQVTESQVIQAPNQNPIAKANNVVISTINPVQESMINNNDSFLKAVNSINKSTITKSINSAPLKVSFNDTIKEQKSEQQSQCNDKSMTLPNYNATMPQFTEEQKPPARIEFNPLFSYSKNFAKDTQSLSNDPNVTLNNYPVEASKIKIDTKRVILDDRFSSFNIEMPAPYYFKVSQDHEPPRDKEWYLRPHHTETYAPNDKAIPDDLLNTKYISYYGPIEKDEVKTRQQLIEEMIAETRGNIDQLQYEMFTQSQFDKEKEQLYARLEKLKDEAKRDYVPGQFLDKAKKSGKITDMLESGEPQTFSQMFEGNEQIHQTNFAIETYEKLRSEMRNKEQQILIQKRKEEYERIRPPRKDWYTLKGEDFIEEMRRNKMVINATPEYFEKIKQLTSTELY